MSSEQKLCIDEALLEQPVNQSAPENRDDRWPSLLTVIGFAFLTFNSGMAVYRSNWDLRTILFVAFSYLDLVMIFHCLRQYEKTPFGSPDRERLKIIVWILTTMLTIVFSFKVAEVMPFPMQIVVWAMAWATVFGGCCALFLHRLWAKV
ncbi:hypothetical protein ACP4OV_009275 [Aristida adscensionis]